MQIIQLSLFPEKTCPKCKLSQPLDHFSPQKGNRDGLSSHCKACKSKRTQLWTAQNYDRKRAYERALYHNNKETFREHERRWQKRHPKTYFIRVNRYRARKHRAEGSFTNQEWLDLCAKYNFRCLACGRQTKLTIDHIKPLSKGGTNFISNIQPLCKPCNSSKCDREIDYRPNLT